MATYTVIEIARSGGINERGERHYTRTFQVTSTNVQDGPAVIAGQVDYTLYESYPVAGEEDPNAILKAVETRNTDTLGVWEVTLNYDSARNEVDRGVTQPSSTGQPQATKTPTSPGQASNQTQPNLRPWVIKWGSVKTTRLLVKDLSDTPQDVVTSAGQPFDPPIEVPTSHPTVSVTAFFSVADSYNIQKYMDTVNDSEFMGWPRDCARCTDYQITSQYDNGAFFFQVDVTIEFKPGGWNPVKVLDAGTMQRYRVGEPLKVITDHTGNPVTSPVPLDGAGQKLNVGGTPVYLEFQGYERQNFKKLLKQN